MPSSLPPGLSPTEEEDRRPKRRSLTLEGEARVHGLPYRPKNRRYPPRSWDESFQALVEYEQQHGDCNVPARYKKDPALTHWIYRQKRNTMLTLEQRNKLNQLEFASNPSPKSSSGETLDNRSSNLNDVKWEQSFDCLLEFKRKSGHCNTPSTGPSTTKLGRWANRQRVSYRIGVLKTERAKKLNAVGFSWSPGRNSRRKAFSETVVRHSDPDDVMLRKKSSARLNGLSFAWKTNGVERGKSSLSETVKGTRSTATFNAKWGEMLDGLLEFKRKHGHYNVPTCGANLTILGTWVNNQRVNYRKGVIKPERVKKLNAVGFTWNVPSAGRRSKSAPSETVARNSDPVDIVDPDQYLDTSLQESTNDEEEQVEGWYCPLCHCVRKSTTALVCKSRSSFALIVVPIDG
jgi:hypothetical protein